MDILLKSSGGFYQVSADSRLLSLRKVFIEDEITAGTAGEFVKKIMLLNAEDPDKPIDVIINSTGGEINSGMAMYDVIQASRAPIRMFCVGRAYSMAAVLLSCGCHGRYILPHSEVMIHEPLLTSRIGGSSSSIQSISDNMQKEKRKMNLILSKHTGQTLEFIEKATGYDHYLSAEESVEFGICDRIISFNMIMEG